MNNKLLLIYAFTLILFISNGCKNYFGEGEIEVYFNSINANGPLIQVDSCTCNPSEVRIGLVSRNSYHITGLSPLKDQVNFLLEEKYAFKDQIRAEKYNEYSISIILLKKIPTNGIYIEGRFQNKKIQISIFENILLKATGSSLNLADGATRKMIATLNFQKLLSTITEADLNNALPTGNVIIISPDPNLDLYNKILSQLSSSISVRFE